ncbi:hypothetical protein D3C79_800600 [compost metagenome]
MGNNPVNGFDIDGGWNEGDDLEVKALGGSKFEVIGGTANSDKNIYLMEDGKRVGVLGQMLTEYSFHGESGKAVKGAIIDLNDRSGQNFFDNEIKGVGLIDYLLNAKGWEPYDFKTRGLIKGESRGEETYRGMIFEGKLASARDIGNYAAGYVAAKNGMAWATARFGFDALQTKQENKTWNVLRWKKWAIEGQPTQRAQRSGHSPMYPSKKYEQEAKERLWLMQTNPFLGQPKW